MMDEMYFSFIPLFAALIGGSLIFVFHLIRTPRLFLEEAESERDSALGQLQELSQADTTRQARLKEIARSMHFHAESGVNITKNKLMFSSALGVTWMSEAEVLVKDELSPNVEEQWRKIATCGRDNWLLDKNTHIEISREVVTSFAAALETVSCGLTVDDLH